MIHDHLYAGKAETPVFGFPKDDGNPVYILHQGNWIGVLKRESGWIHVISIAGEGWVKSEDVEERPPFSLHILWSPGNPVSYVSIP